MWSRFFESAKQTPEFSGDPCSRHFSEPSAHSAAALRKQTGASPLKSPLLLSRSVPPDEKIPVPPQLTTPEPTNLSVVAGRSAVVGAAVAFLKSPRQKRTQVENRKAAEDKSAAMTTIEHQISTLRQSEHDLKKQLLRARAESLATGNLVDTLIDQGNDLRLERESWRLVTRAVINAASQISNYRAEAAINATAQCMTWRAIATAFEAIQNETFTPL